MHAAVTFIVSGVVFGLSAGLSPGPLLTLVISETLRHGAREGVKVALSPLLTDLPIVCLTLMVLSRLSDMQPVLGVLFLGGSAFLLYLGVESISFRGVNSGSKQERPQSIRKGVITNFLNPHPYLFWLSIGGPTVLKSLDTGMHAAGGFLLAFYTLLVGSKVILAMVVGRSRRFLRSGVYIYTIRFLGAVLLVFAVQFFREGLRAFSLM